MTSFSPIKSHLATPKQHSHAGEVSVKIGAAEITDAIFAANFTFATNENSKADLRIDARHPAVFDIDWRSPVSAIANSDRPVFAGDVTEVRVDGPQIVITAVGHAALNETISTKYEAKGPAGEDLVYALVRESGLASDQIDIDSSFNSHPEVFEVVFPLEGIAPFEGQITVGKVTLTTGSRVLPLLQEFSESEMVAEFIAHSNFAVVYVTATRMFDAERQAVSEVDIALAWLTVRSQYSLAVLPDLSIPTWRRTVGQAKPSVKGVVYVRGMISRRRWVRTIEVLRATPDLPLDDPSLLLSRPALVRAAPEATIQALMSCARAGQLLDPATRITAIWDAFEFYAGKTKIPELYSRAELRAIKRSLPAGLPSAKRRRIEDMLGQLNSAPLLARLRQRISQDGVPVTEADFTLIAELRTIRNDLVHGRVGRSDVSVDAIDRGVAILARILLHSLSELGPVGVEAWRRGGVELR